MNDIRYTSTVLQLAQSPLLDRLTHAELLVWLQLLRSSCVLGRKMVLHNEDLHRTSRVAQRALVGLRKRGVIKITYSGRHRLGVRTLELL